MGLSTIPQWLADACQVRIETCAQMIVTDILFQRPIIPALGIYFMQVHVTKGWISDVSPQTAPPSSLGEALH